ncbi:septation ring formation regulator [Thermolongibacillus altinsuensis]|uniref:Septation ring formation regulator EzrA n=1 Tax=Thermolongibacillus altinsuensis TaxID=575256 RepID=A0A4R1QG54_9BACL|nr:septation ring formation regulator EzrA [Thermolongibacillus altinsuensis]TCL51799.1 septation ring formation regulator [Thermolongibacillus altinsuensis]GMB07325.1 septation ring formation regulator EzrA [Thermolongibacillus altinsuensis]
MKLVIMILLLIAGVITYSYIYRKRLYKQIDRLEEWKIALMNRPVPEELSKVKSLNLMGETEQLFERWRNEWDEIVAVKLPDIEEKLIDIEEEIVKYRFVKAKAELLKTEQQLRKIEEEIQQILVELQELIGSEEKNRTEIEQLKELYRQVKKALLTHRHSFGNAEMSLEQRVNELQEKFHEFTELTKEGNYLAAREVVLYINNELNELNELIEQIPLLLSDCQVEIPAQLDNILDGYREMLEKGYILDHLPIEKEVEEIRQKLEHCMMLIETLALHEAQKELAEIKDDIDTLYDLLEKEVLAQQFVQNEIGNIEQTLYQLEEETKETRDETLFVQQSYQLSQSDLEKYRQIEKQVQQLMKRFMLIQTKLLEERLAHSFVQEELEEILAQIQAVKEQHKQFRDLLYALRKDELAAREKLAEMKKRLSEALRLVKKSKLPGLPQSYTLQLGEARESLTRVSLKLDEKPLNMEAVNQTLDEATILVQKICEQTKEMIEQAELVEKVIQYGNRYRSRYPEVTEELEEAEQLFRNYEYELALQKAIAAVEQVERGAFERIQALLKENE